MSALDTTYSYIRTRDEFGRQPQFLEDHGRVHANIKPNRLQRKKIRRWANCDKNIQAIEPINNTEMNTIRTLWSDFSMMHEEGGWPKDVKMIDPENVTRWRKRLEKDDAFQVAMPVMTENMEELIMNSNSMNVYKELFQNTWKYPEDKKKHPYAHVVSEFLDPTATERAVSHITWAGDWGRLGVSYCPFEFDPSLRQKPNEAFFFEVEIPSRPEGMIRAPSQITDIRYHPKDPHSIIGGMFNGQVATWDNRVGPNAQATSALDKSHGDVCSSALWINSKSGCEFFSAGMDGQVIWWDERNLSEVIEVTWLDPEKGSCSPEKALPCTVLEYEHTIPTKFTAGTENGNVMIFMRKGKTPNDKLVNIFKEHRGRVRALHRNPMFVKNILSVGQDCVRLYTEDCRESSILWTAPRDCLYTYGHWIPTRPSSFVACRMDGYVDFWDLLKHPVRPILSTKVSKEILTTLEPSDDGKFIAVGTDHGKVRLLKPAEYMTTFAKNDKPHLASIFDRETRREKFLEQRHREIRLRKRDKEKAEAEKKKLDEEREAQREAALKKELETGEVTPLPDFSGGRAFDVAYEARNDPVLQVERKFFMDMEQEMEEKGIDAFPDKRKTTAEEEEEEEEKKTKSNKDLVTESDFSIAAADLTANDYEPEEEEDEEETAPSGERQAAGHPTQADEDENEDIREEEEEHRVPHEEGNDQQGEDEEEDERPEEEEEDERPEEEEEDGRPEDAEEYERQEDEEEDDEGPDEDEEEFNEEDDNEE